MELDEIRSITIQVLHDYNAGMFLSEPSLQLGILKRKVEESQAYANLISKHCGDIHNAKMSKEDEEKFREVVHNLLIEGVLMWGKSIDPYESTAPYISITSYGRKVLEAGEIIPHDPDGYIAHFKNKVPDVESVILMYLTESIQCFNRNNLVASSVMLGVASEAAFNVLFGAVKNSITDPKKKTKLKN